MGWFREDRLIHGHPVRRVAPRGLLVLASLSALALAAPPVQAVAQEYQEEPVAQSMQEPLLVAQDGELASGSWGGCQWDVSQDGILTIHAGEVGDVTGVQGWLNSTIKDKITSVVISESVIGPSSYANLFRGMTNLQSVNLSGLNSTSAIYSMYAKSMASMFNGCTKLESITFGDGFDTSDMTDMSNMFYGCTQLASITFGQNWSTLSVTNMGSMFEGCSALTSLDTSGWYNSQVFSMRNMFKGCTQLASITFGQNWSRESVTDMTSMFEGCSALTSLDTSDWNTSNVQQYANMFKGCTGLTSFTVGQNYNIKYTDMFPDANNATNKWWSCENREWLSKEDICSSTYSNKAGTYTTKSIPSFKTYSLTLDGMIGVNFYCDLSSVPDEDLSTTHVDFMLHNVPQTDNFDLNKIAPNGPYTLDHYPFTCKVKSIEMAEDIQAELFCGTAKKADTSGSVMGYIDYVTNPQTTGFDDETINLAKAIADYGHGMQVFLSKSNGWDINDYEYIHGFKSWQEWLPQAAAYKTDVAPYKITASGYSTEKLKELTYSLVLDADTSIYIYVTLNSAPLGKVTASAGGVPLYVDPLTDKVYRVEIPNIPAHKLGVMNTVSIKDGDDSLVTVNVSPYSYAYDVLNHPEKVFPGETDAQDNAKLAVMSLYDYGKATVDYRDSHYA